MNQGSLFNLNTKTTTMISMRLTIRKDQDVLKMKTVFTIDSKTSKTSMNIQARINLMKIEALWAKLPTMISTREMKSSMDVKLALIALLTVRQLSKIPNFTMMIDINQIYMKRKKFLKNKQEINKDKQKKIDGKKISNLLNSGKKKLPRRNFICSRPINTSSIERAHLSKVKKKLGEKNKKTMITKLKKYKIKLKS